jgi:hypothetical protein
MASRATGAVKRGMLQVTEGLHMKTLVLITSTAFVFVATEAAAADVAMRRVLSCKGDDANVEVFIPESVWSGSGVANARLDKEVTGAYALDLTEAGKGKVLEPVHVRYSKDKKAVIVDQYTRKLPPTQIAVTGATVDFDQRFATGVKCGPFNDE